MYRRATQVLKRRFRTHKTPRTVSFRRTSTIPSQRNWDPNAIYPNEPGHVRVTGITLRDGHQSLNGGMHRIDLLEKAAPLIDKIRPPGMKFPGQEEIGGGTTVDFPLRFKGEDPFRNMERISRHLPNTPTSALIRSDSLCGYNVNPRDVVRAFITRYAQCGVDIFRNFDAYNNVANHETVAKAVIDAKKHYQAAITFTSHEDPTLFNVRWVSDLARAFKILGAHSICIKDMAGIASPRLMKAWVTELKDTVPELPVVIHSHYTTGFSPITYIQAIEAGASAVDCGISTLSGRSGHPSMEVFTQVLTDMGYDLGWGDGKDAQAAMKVVADLYREYSPRYEFSEMKMAGAVDYRVYTQGIPGGQISIMRNELVSSGYGHLFDNVIEQIQRVRTQVGGVALVTPTSEHVARQSIVNAMNGQDFQTTMESPLWGGYSEMLRGVMGHPPGKMDRKLQRRALLEFVENAIQKTIGIDDESAKEFLLSQSEKIVDFMWAKSEPLQDLRRSQDVETRIDQLKGLLGANKVVPNEIDQFKSKLADLEKESSDLKSRLPSNIDEMNSEYVAILKRNPSEGTLKELIRETGCESLLKENKLSPDQFLNVLVAGSFCTVCPSSIIPEGGMERAMDDVESMAVEHDFEYVPPRGSKEFEEWAILACMFAHAQNIALNWFKHHLTNIQFWDNKYPADFPFERDEESDGSGFLSATALTLYPFVSEAHGPGDGISNEIRWSESELRRLVGSDVKRMKRAEKRLAELAQYVPENPNREILKQREVDRVEAARAEAEKCIQGKLRTSLYATKNHDAGLEIDFQGNTERNVQRALQFE